MSPEQLAGRDADARSDIFSFGAVFYQMISGRRAFDLMAAGGLTTPIREEDRIVFSTVCPIGSSEALEHVVRTCLIKIPTPVGRPPATLRSSCVGSPQAWGTSVGKTRFQDKSASRLDRPTFLLLVIVGVLGTRQFARAPDSARTVRSSLTPRSIALVSVGTNAGPAVLSAEVLASIHRFQCRAENNAVVRRLDSLAAQVVGGTDGASYPFWSPDASSMASSPIRS